MYDEKSLDTVCGALCYAIGIEPPATAEKANAEKMVQNLKKAGFDAVIK